MSGTQVGSVYQKIIEEVINDSANTFDEEGVEKALLEDLRQQWQQKLSERGCAAFPWDPAPTLAGTSNTTAASTSAPANAPVKQEPPIIKQEPVYPEYSSTANQSGGRNNVPSSYGAPNATAAARAAGHLHEKFGGAASAQVNQLQAQAHLAQKSNPPPSQAADARQQYNQQMANAMKQQQHANNMPPQQRAPVAAAQTDGSSDWDATVEERRTVTHTSTREADLTIRQMVEQNALQMEGGGLMLPASERANTRSQLVSAQKQPSKGIPQVDGADLDDDVKAEADEDAINSDLDDPDDDAIGETEDDPSTGELMLCTYDKVQRVKNKWKCTLKDGVLTTGGKEYVFGKAQGEFEW